jgi:hypothetical protein
MVKTTTWAGYLIVVGMIGNEFWLLELMTMNAVHKKTGTQRVKKIFYFS